MECEVCISLWSRWLDDPISVLESLVTIAAIVIGGFWTYRLFVRKRLGYPKVRIGHAVSMVVDAGGHKILHVNVRIENCGNVLVSLQSADTWVQLVLPADERTQEELSRHDPLGTHVDLEVEWPMIARRVRTWDAGKFEIEPGEEDEILYDFVIEEELEVVQVYTFLANAKKRRKGLGWSRTTRCHVRGVSEEGDRRSLLPASGDSEMVERFETKKQRPPKTKQQPRRDTPRRLDEQQVPKKPLPAKNGGKQ